MTTVIANSITINSASGINGYGPFYNNRNITSVDLGHAPWTNNSMIRAFNYCNKLTDVNNINENITNMAYTFYYCQNLVNTPVIPNGVTNMYSTFNGCIKLQEAPTIPNSIQDLTYTFAGCTNLVNAPSIPNSITAISGTFSGCKSLIALPDIPDEVTNMSYTFDDCNNIVTFSKVPSAVMNLYRTFNSCSKLQGDIYIYSADINYASDCFGNTTLSKNVYIPFNTQHSIYTITYNTFNSSGYNTSSIKHGVTIKENPKFKVENNCFYSTDEGVVADYVDKKNVTSITIPTSINGTLITKHCLTNLSDYNNLVSIDFNGIPAIRNDFTLSGKNLQTVANLNISNIATLAQKFRYDYNLTSVTFTGNSTKATSMYNCFLYCNNLLELPPIPNEITNLRSAFAVCEKITSAPTIPNGVTDMDNAFGSCYNLATAPIIPNNVSRMGSTFSGCNKLTTAPEIPASVTLMTYTFSLCTKLTGNIRIHSNQITDAEGCFNYCNDSLRKNVYIPFKYENGVYTKTYNAFIAAGYTTTGSVNKVYLMDSGEH